MNELSRQPWRSSIWRPRCVLIPRLSHVIPFCLSFILPLFCGCGGGADYGSTQDENNFARLVSELGGEV